MSRGSRQEALVETLAAVVAADLPYVLVGGWAVSAIRTPRFTTDVDLVALRRSLAEYETVLGELDYEKVGESSPAPRYDGEAVRFERDVGNPVAFDLMLDSLGCRQTDAEWSYRYLDQHSRPAALAFGGGLEVRIPEPELLVATKLHSGRLADARDLVELSRDVRFHRVEKHLHRGDQSRLAEQIELVLDRVTDDGFADSFKGVFGRGELPDEAIDDLVAFLESQRARLD